MFRRHLTLLLALSAAVLGACGGSSPPLSDITGNVCTPGGIWRAVDGTIAIIDESESSQTHLVLPDGSQFVGELAGTNFSGEDDCFLDDANSRLSVALPLGQVLPDGSVAAAGNVVGIWQKRRGDLIIEGSLDTAAGGVVDLAFTGAYDPLHLEPSDTAAVAGVYRLSSDPGSEVLTIDAEGVFISQNPSTGCVLTGRMEPKDPSVNVYGVLATYANCSGAEEALNDAPVKGLATYDESKSPDVLLIALDVIGSAQHYSIVMLLERL